MKILIISQYFWPESFIINGLAVELKNRQHEVRVLTGLPNYPTGQFYEGFSFWKGPWKDCYEGVPIMRVPLLSRGQGFLRLALNYFSFVISGTLFSLLHQTSDAEVILCYAPSPITSCLPAIFLRYKNKVPLLFWVQDLWPESVMAVRNIKSDFILKKLKQLVRFIYHRCDLILTQSNAFIPSILANNIPENKIKYVPNWADPFPETSVNPDWINDLPVGFRVGFAGNLGVAQDLLTLLQAATLLKNTTDIKWIIVGDGREKKWLEDEVQQRGLQHCVFTIGRKPYSEMKPFFDVCDALYVSLKKSEIFSLTIPSKLQAYMSAGKPLLAGLDGEGARIVEEAKAGLTTTSENPAGLAEQILKMIGLTSVEREQMGGRAAAYYKQHFERNTVISQLEVLMQSQVDLNKK